jgi:predicted RNA-binding protein YlqC (UPF0109 family)
MTESRCELHQLLVQMVRCLVDIQEDVEVSLDEAGTPPTFHVRVNPLDIAKVIGRQGRNARSIRTLISAGAMKSNDHVSVNIVGTSER